MHVSVNVLCGESDNELARLFLTPSYAPFLCTAAPSLFSSSLLSSYIYFTLNLLLATPLLHPLLLSNCVKDDIPLLRVLTINQYPQAI